MDFIKPKKLALQRMPFKEVKRLFTEGKYLQIISKDLVSRMYKQLLEFSNIKTSRKNEQMVMRRHF